MTDHPMTPPPELVNKWCHEDGDEIKTSPRWFFSVCAKAAQWGANRELEACCEWLVSKLTFREDGIRFADELRNARRPKPPSLKEQALSDLKNAYNADMIDDTTFENIRRALEALPND